MASLERGNMQHQNRNQQHWNELGSAYSDNWRYPAKRVLSDLELEFVERHVPRRPDLAVMDVGIGTGRIVQRLLNITEVGELYGLDISPRMVEVTRSVVGDNPKVRNLQVCDVSADSIPVSRELDFVCCVRVLKYNSNWSAIVAKLAANLVPGGALVLTMPNRHSVTRFSRAYPVDYYLTTKAELRAVLADASCDLVEMAGFTKLPDLFYRASSSAVAARTLLGVERGLDKATGRAFLARELFVAARRL